MDMLQNYFLIDFTRFTAHTLSALLDIVREQIKFIFININLLRKRKKKFINTNRYYGVPDFLKFHQGLAENSDFGSGIKKTIIHNSIGVYSRIQCYADSVIQVTDWQMNDSLGRMSHEI